MQEAPRVLRKAIVRAWRVARVVVRVVTLWVLDVSLSVILWLGARTRRVQPTRRSSLTSRPDIRTDLLRRQKGKCAYCSDVISDIKGNYEVDHKTPLARQGEDRPENLQALCRRCNKRKGARTHQEFLHYLKHHNDRETFERFKRAPKYLTPRELLYRAQLPLVVALSVTGLIVGNETIERPFLGAGAFCVLTITWMIGLWKRGTRTGALDD